MKIRNTISNLKIFHVLMCGMLLTGCGGGSTDEQPAPVTPTAKSWGPVESIETNSETALAPRVATSGNGNAIVAWQQRDANGQYDIWVNYYDYSSDSWQKPEVIESLAGSSRYPKIAMDSQGNAMVIWLIGNDLMGAYFTESTRNWGTSMKVDEDDGGVDNYNLVASNSGHILAGWEQTDSSGTVNDVWVNRFNINTGTWDGATRIETGAFSADAPNLAVDDNGNAVAVWSQKENVTGIDNIWVAYFDSSTNAWETAETIETSSNDADFPEVAMDPLTGNAMVVWQQDDGSGTRTDDAWAIYYESATKTLTGPMLIESSSESITRPKVSASQNGSFVAVWLQDEPGGAFFRDVLTSQFDPVAKTWGNSVLIESNMGDAYNQSIKVDPEGNIMVSWIQEDPANFFEKNVWANYFDSNSASWTGETQLDMNNQRVDSVDLVISPMGNAIATWFQDDGTGNQVIDVVATVFRL